jgi:hypothetical protein
MWSDRDLYEYDPYEDEDEERDEDDCMDCGLCDACIEQSRAFAEQMEAEKCTCGFGEDDYTKAFGGHAPKCPAAIPF